MPTYLYRCPTCDSYSDVHATFEEKNDLHPICPFDKVELKHIITAPFIAAAARPTNPGAQNTHAKNVKQKEWDKDISAVQQMKKEGIVPKRVDGSDKWLATAKDKMEIEQFHSYNDISLAKDVHEELKVPKPIEEVKKIAAHNNKVLADAL